MDAPDLALPAAWTHVDVPPPVLSPSSGVTIDRWAAWSGAGDAAGRGVVGCFGLPLGTWTDEATSLALDRLDAAVGGVARRLDPGLELRREGEVRTPTTASRTFAAARDGNGADPHPIIARTWLGFATEAGSSRLEACFALCAPATRDCESALAGATPPRFEAPPPANGLVVAAVYGVHHPRAVAGGAVTAFLCLGVLAVWTRPRPRRK